MGNGAPTDMPRTRALPAPTRVSPQATGSRPDRSPATIEDLAAGVVMLTRAITETVEIDGRRMEVWLKPRRRGRTMPKQEQHVGTGFLVATDRDTCLVTAAHVAKEMDADACISLARRGGRRASLRLRELTGTGSKRLRWVRVGHADLAVLRLREAPPTLGRHVLPARLLEGPAAPSRDLALVTMGFPLGLCSETRFVAIAMWAHAASGIMQLRGSGMRGPADFFLLDHPGIGGVSGGPVFVAPQARVDESGAVTVIGPRCAGLLSQTLSDDKGAQFGLVTPSPIIRRAIAAAVKRRSGT